MIYHGIPWIFVPFNVSWFFMENHEHFTLKYHAEPWTYKLEIPWHTMKILTWNTMKYHEMLLPWNFDEKNIMVIHEKVCHLTRWMFMLCHGISWYLMIIHAINTMKYHENTMENHEISCLKKAGSHPFPPRPFAPVREMGKTVANGKLNGKNGKKRQWTPKEWFMSGFLLKFLTNT